MDIGLSITGETFVAPVLVIEGANEKSLAELAAETARRVPEVARSRPAQAAGLEKVGLAGAVWVLAPGHHAVGCSGRSHSSVRRPGTFQVSTVPVESAATSVFVASGVLVGGQVSSRVVPVDGQPAVRPSMTITLSGRSRCLGRTCGRAATGGGQGGAGAPGAGRSCGRRTCRAERKRFRSS